MLAKGQDIGPILGTKRRSYVEENIAAVAISLSADNLRLLDEIAPKGVATGERYPDMSAIDR